MAHQEPDDDTTLEMLAETEHYAVYVGYDDSGEPIYNVELASITLHLFQEEWDELIELIQAANKATTK
jgi:hypothetical protein